MTAPTHIAFGAWISYMISSDPLCVSVCILGSLLPDMDHPRSAIGRLLNLFWRLSSRINQKWGHRKALHGRPFWGFLLLLTFAISHFFPAPWLTYLPVGALLHCLLDQCNKPGVQTWLPFSDKTVVIFKRSWRIRNGSAAEYMLLCVFLFCAVLTFHIRDTGGIRVLVNRLSGAHDITVQEYARAGTVRCHIRGEYRWKDGRIEPVDWLIVGSEKGRLVCWNGERLIRTKRDGYFLSSYLIRTKQDWKAFRSADMIRLSKSAFFFSGTHWHYAPPGEPAFGRIKTLDGDPPEILRRDQWPY